MGTARVSMFGGSGFRGFGFGRFWFYDFFLRPLSVHSRTVPLQTLRGSFVETSFIFEGFTGIEGVSI